MLMVLTVREPAPAGVMVKAFWDEVVNGTFPKFQVLGVTVMPVDEEVTVNALASTAVSAPVVTVSVRGPTVAAGSILSTAVALVEEVTVNETRVMPLPNAAVVVPW